LDIYFVNFHQTEFEILGLQVFEAKPSTTAKATHKIILAGWQARSQAGGAFGSGGPKLFLFLTNFVSKKNFCKDETKTKILLLKTYFLPKP